ncbi:C1 family peptidase [Nitrincola sp.]|uniref:C1 family peptidase n=1 Tax=Nitrincola sp. TaxID=1926584 RepID=UPI003A8FAB3D
MQQARCKALSGCFVALTLALGSFAPVWGQSLPGTGAVLDMQAYGQVPRGAPLTRGNYEGLPGRHSLEAFTPTPGDQGNQGSCVGWAVAYAARTMTEARVHELAPRHVVDRHVFSPAYVYNQIALDGCDSGSMIHHALNLIEREGVVPLSEFPYDANTCTQPIQPQQRSQAASYRIAGWRALTSPGARATHVPTRRALAADRPVIIGMLVPDSFMDSRAIRANSGHWIPTASDYQTLELYPDELYGHAMTVVGYDDQRFGGAFRIINSWGTDWADEGYVWVSYDDYARFVMQAYEIIPIEPELPAVPNLGGRLGFMHIDGQRMTATQTDTLTWRMDQAYPSGTRFRVELDSVHNGYAYVMGGDLTGRYVEIFPRTHQTSALLMEGETLVMPGPTEDFYTRMDDTLGTDYYIVLFSREPLDMENILARVNAGSGGPQARLASALGKRLVEPEVLAHVTGGIGAEGYLAEGAVLPMIVEIEHVAPSTDYQDQHPPQIVVQSPTTDIFEEVASGQRIYRVDSRKFQIQGVAQDESAIQTLQVSGALQSRYSSRGPFEATLELPLGEQEIEVEISATDAAGNTTSQIIRVVLDDT